MQFSWSRKRAAEVNNFLNALPVPILQNLWMNFANVDDLKRLRSCLFLNSAAFGSPTGLQRAAAYNINVWPSLPATASDPERCTEKF